MDTARKNSGVIFFGSPDFAIPPLEILSASEFRPDLVVTQPDRPAGRGKRPAPTPVRLAAEAKGIPVRIMASMREEGAIEALEALDPRYLVVVAFGIVFPARALRIASRANVNLHASLLPAYRGASPVNAAIVNGERYTGVTTMEMVEELDAGPIYLQRRVPIDPAENAGGLSARLSESGAGLLLETLRGIEAGTVAPREQPEEGVSHAPRLRKSDGYIDWKRDADAVRDHIRGMNPWPGSFTYHEGNYLKILSAERGGETGGGAPAGSVLRADRDGIVVACGTGAVRITAIQTAGRKALGAEEFLNGYSIEIGDTFGREDER
ncbi:MAG TPA: methionyl-tRNA formyltransferase [Candidatus Eisenbacteria bacterium]|uniref:Methionyl-tRNA formyltransferase n=1 Tax=Eiseniibacteriota bacterium TaxID=2212470 RepID=A0A7V2AV66_UNCEI|nr:methionyl-tRNA formyltransferase [Candidatus Eisenbacteria bacterium]